LFACLGMTSACEMASEGGSEQEELLRATSATSANTKAAGVLNAQVGLATRVSGLDATSFRAVVTTTNPKCDLTSVIWSEHDAKLLLALVLRGMCSVLDGCESWLWDALELGAEGSVTLSASSSARFAAEAKALRSAGQERRAALVEEWETNAASDLESVSSIGLSAAAVQEVIVNASDGAYMRTLYTRARQTSAAALAAACHGRSSGLPDLATRNKALPVLGAVESASGGGALDTALDTSCENVVPGKTYCTSLDPQHEWATGSSPHRMNVAFAVSARRCEPCQDGYGVGTLRLIRNTRNQAMTMCDTSTSCNPTADTRVPACTCMN
jgi:hypothetical protein